MPFPGPYPGTNLPLPLLPGTPNPPGVGIQPITSTPSQVPHPFHPALNMMFRRSTSTRTFWCRISRRYLERCRRRCQRHRRRPTRAPAHSRTISRVLSTIPTASCWTRSLTRKSLASSRSTSRRTRNRRLASRRSALVACSRPSATSRFWGSLTKLKIRRPIPSLWPPLPTGYLSYRAEHYHQRLCLLS